MVKAEGFAYDPKTRGWTERVVYEARNRQEAINWMRFNQNYMCRLRIVDEPAGRGVIEEDVFFD